MPDDHPIAAEAHLIAGQIERRRNRVRFAERAFLHAIRLDLSLALAHRELIRIYGIQVRRAEFNREFEVLAGLTTLSFDDVYHWTSVRNNLWEPGDVAEELFRFVEADPEDRWSRLALADVFRRMGRSVQSLRTLSILPPDDPEALAIRVQIALDLEDGKEADKLLAAGPARIPHWHDYADAKRSPSGMWLRPCTTSGSLTPRTPTIPRHSMACASLIG